MTVTRILTLTITLTLTLTLNLTLNLILILTEPYYKDSVHRDSPVDAYAFNNPLIYNHGSAVARGYSAAMGQDTCFNLGPSIGSPYQSASVCFLLPVTPFCLRMYVRIIHVFMYYTPLKKLRYDICKVA